MNPDELILLLKSMSAAREVSEAVQRRELQAAHGWDLHRWQAEAVPEAVRFTHLDRRGRPDTAVLCVAAAEGCAWVYETAQRLAQVPTTVLMLEP
jgi:hypothetical protein